MAKKKNTLAARIRSLREAKGMTQRQLAQAAELSQGAIDGLETSRSLEPKATTLAALARALGTTCEELLGGQL